MNSSIINPDLATYDAWKITPPCELDNPYCSHNCPYSYECESPVEYEDDVDEVV